MAQEKPFDAAVILAWLASRNESNVFSEAAVVHLQSLITDTHCLVVVTLGPRSGGSVLSANSGTVPSQNSLQFRRAL
jgi:hypothetical protein